MPRIELGDDFYLFRADPDAYQPDLIISAHGAANGKSFIVPDVGTLCFYSAHRSETLDPGLDNIAFRSKPIVETIPPSQVSHDYDLGKYQGRHTPHPTTGEPVETYDRIEERMNYVLNKLPAMRQQADAARAGSYRSAVPPIAETISFDVLTIRHRYTRWSTPTLSRALEAVRTHLNEEHTYTNVHCSFCRS